MICGICRGGHPTGECYAGGDTDAELDAIEERAAGAIVQAPSHTEAAETLVTQLSKALERSMLYIELHAQAHPEWNGNRVDDRRLAKVALDTARNVLPSLLVRARRIEELEAELAEMRALYLSAQSEEQVACSELRCGSCGDTMTSRVGTELKAARDEAVAELVAISATREDAYVPNAALLKYEHVAAQLTAANARADAAEAKLAIQSVLLEVVDERVRQDKQWGGPEHDDDHTCEDWTWYIDKQRIRAKVSGGSANFRKAMVKIAALAVAAIQSYDRLSAAKAGT